MKTLERRMGSNWFRLLQALLCTGWLSQGCGGTTVPDSAQGGAGTTNATSGGAVSASGGTTGEVASSTTGGAALPANGGTTSGLCFSPTQNLSSAYQVGSKGCACNSATDVDVCVQGVALLCEGSRWIAVEDGPCMPQYVAGGSGGTGGSSTAVRASGGTGGNTTAILASGGATVGSSSTATCFTPSASVRPGTQGGCPCASGSAAVCMGGTGFICSSGYWIAVYDGPCMPVPSNTGGSSSVGGSSTRVSMAGSSTGGSSTGGSSTGGTSASKQCGARAGNTCSSSEYCAYKAGQYCGQADAQATCQPRPQGCESVVAPVCGCDGKPYENSCLAALSGTGVYANGVCTL